MRKQIIFSALLALSAVGGLSLCPTTAMASVQQQTIKVSGQVVDREGEPLIGATIKVKGAQNGVITDFDGNFSIDAPSNATLVVSYVGYKDREIAVRGRAIIEKIELESDSQLLDQVVVIGYGTQKKADLTGSVSVVNADELKRVSHSNISSMLEGKVAGVQITTDGQPGADPSVRIRGLGSFSGTAPLYVIDGVPMGTTIRDFSPNDIETIQVLKDASAAAIYGSRAANGVIIITTKNGQKEQPLKLEYKGYFGVDVINKSVYDVMDADQYSQYLGMAAANSASVLPGGYKLGEDGKYHFLDNTNTNWMDEVFKTGFRQNHNVNLSGGGAHNTYNVALDYFQQKGTLEGAGPNYQRFTARVNNTMETKFIKFRTSIVYSHSNQDGFGYGVGDYVQGIYSGISNVLRQSVLMQPTIKAYDPTTWVLDGRVPGAEDFNYDAYGYGVYYTDVHGDISVVNPLLMNNLMSRNTIVDRILTTGSADVDLFKMVGFENKNHKLNYKINLSYNKTNRYEKRWVGAWFESSRINLAKTNEKLEESKWSYSDFLVENTINYDGTIGLHHINLLGGITYEEENEHNLYANGVNFTEPYFLQIGNGETRDASSSENKHTLASIIGRFIYDYDGKYLLSAVVRRDGSSRLTKDLRWATFPSVSLGWRFDKEKFFPIDHNIVNMFKVRASYGELGNENIGNYQFQATMRRNFMTYSFGNNPVSGTALDIFSNQNIAWERKKSFNVGIDLALFNNRIEFSAEWYKNKSEDLLYSVSLPDNSGTGGYNNPAYAVTMNAASMDNTGVEFSLTYRNRDHALKHEISANLSTTRNKVTSLGTGKDFQRDGDYITYVGQEVGQFYGYVFEGIARTQADLDDHATQNGATIGDYLYKDMNNDGQITDDDRVVLGSGMPKVNFGLSARLEYKNFDLNISTFGVLGFKVADDIYNSLNSSYGYDNKDVNILNANRWSDDGSTYLSDVPRTHLIATGELWNDYLSDRKIQNAAYWKIANVELGYNIPNKVFNGIITGARIYVSAQNLYTFTGYKGYNVDFYPGTWTPGYNYCSYPSARSFMAGINFSF